MALCKRCGRKIRFIKMQTGRFAPVNINKRTIRKDGGNVVLITEDGEIIQGTPASLEDGATGIGFQPHRCYR